MEKYATTRKFVVPYSDIVVHKDNFVKLPFMYHTRHKNFLYFFFFFFKSTITHTRQIMIYVQSYLYETAS